MITLAVSVPAINGMIPAPLVSPCFLVYGHLPGAFQRWTAPDRCDPQRSAQLTLPAPHHDDSQLVAEINAALLGMPRFENRAACSPVWFPTSLTLQRTPSPTRSWLGQGLCQHRADTRPGNPGGAHRLRWSTIQAVRRTACAGILPRADPRPDDPAAHGLAPPRFHWPVLCGDRLKVGIDIRRLGFRRRVPPSSSPKGALTLLVVALHRLVDLMVGRWAWAFPCHYITN